VAYVVRSQMKAFATADAYNADYYAHRYAARRGASSSEETKSLVTPAWVEQKEMIRSREDHVKRDQRTVTQKWEEGHKVLGHVEKSDAARPRALLGVTPLTFAGARVKPFSSPLWRARRAVDAAVASLLEYQEARHLAAARSDDPGVVARALHDARLHLADTARALCGGADPHPKDLEEEEGPPPPPTAGEDDDDDAPGGGGRGRGRLEVADRDRSDATVLDALLSLPKGVKLLARFARTLPHTAASSALLGEALQVLDSRESSPNEAFADLDDLLANQLIAFVLPKAPLDILVGAALTYVEAAATNKAKKDSSPAARLAKGLLAHGDHAADHSNDPAAKDGWHLARDDLLAVTETS